MAAETKEFKYTGTRSCKVETWPT